jgi:hypothetical protein
MAVTRIKNNQITDATITASKIASQTLVGSLFANDLTLNSNVSIVGNLTITGSSSNINAINTFITDPFVIFNNGYSGSLANYTIGILVNRNLASLADYGAVNTAWVWDENDGAFAGLTTTDTGVGITTINNSGYANVKVGNLVATHSVTATNYNISQANVIDAKVTTLVATNFSTGNAVISGGYISALANATITTGNAASWYATELNSTTSNITTLTSTTVNAGTTTTATLNSTTGNVTTLNSTTIDAGTATLVTVNSTNGNVTTLTAGNFSSGNAQISGGYADNFPIGANTAAPGTFTTATATTVDAGTTTTATLNSTTGNVTTLGVGTTTSATLNATTGNITTLTSTTVNAGTTTSATLNATNGNISTLGVGTTTTAALNTTTANITNGSASTFVATDFSSGNSVITSGSANSFKIGNATPDSGAFTTLTSNGLTTFTNATQSDSVSTGAVVVTGGVGIAANLNVGGNVTVFGNLLVQGNTTTLNVETLDVEDLNITVAANATSGAEANGAGLTVAGASATLTYLNSDDSWNFNKKLNTTSLTASGNIVAVSGVNATNFTTGALVVPDGGGVGITGDLYVQGASTFQGNIVAGNIVLSGNINVPVGGTFSNTGVFFGNAGGIGALYAGTSTYTALPTTVLQMSGNVNSYAQVNFQNINSGASASTDFVLTADNGDDNDGYINLGINSSTFDDPAFAGYYPNDGYLIMHGLEPSIGNLNIHSHNQNSVIKLIVGGFSDANIRATVSRTGFRVNTSTASTSTTSGALIVDGGVGIGGNIHAAAINDTPVGNTTPSTGAFTTLTTTNLGVTTLVATNFSTANAVITGGSMDGVEIGDTTPTTGKFTTATATTVDAGTTTTATLNTTAANITSGVATNFSSGNAVITGGSLNDSAIGNTTASTGRFTTVVTTGVLTSAGNLVANAGTASTDTTTGALVVAGTGGAGIGGNLNVGYSAIFNTTKTANYDFVVRGDSDDTLVWARPSSTYDSVIIGNSATTSTLVTGAKLIINTTDSMIVPVGTTGQRPGSTGGIDTAGMIRFNTSTGELEYYDGAEWNNTGTTFTVIAADSFDGDNNEINFTLGAVATTNSCIVSINGVVQIPSTAYSVSGTTLTFTQAPATGDKIDVRRLITTSTVTILQSDNGYVAADAQNDSLTISAGASSLVERIRVHTNGNVNVSGNLVLGANIIAGGTNGTNGQFLSSTGTGLQWVSLSASSISNGTSNVTVASNGGVTFNVASANVITVGSTAIVPDANVSINLGNTTNWFGTFYGVSTQAQYADLAENYQADQAYPAGTVLEFGGQEEVTVAMTEGSTKVAGVVSSNPAHLMNGGLRGSNVVALALAGRVPCKVIGPVYKGDMMVSAGYGYARASASPVLGSVIGKALENFEGDKGVIEVVVGRV